MSGLCWALGLQSLLFCFFKFFFSDASLEISCLSPNFKKANSQCWWGQVLSQWFMLSSLPWDGRKTKTSWQFSFSRSLPNLVCCKIFQREVKAVTTLFFWHSLAALPPNLFGGRVMKQVDKKPNDVKKCYSKPISPLINVNISWVVPILQQSKANLFPEVSMQGKSHVSSERLALLNF